MRGCAPMRRLGKVTTCCARWASDLVDGSPWVGNINLTFPYRTPHATRASIITARFPQVPRPPWTVGRNRRGLLSAGLARKIARHVHGDGGGHHLDVYERHCARNLETITGCGSRHAGVSGPTQPSTRRQAPVATAASCVD